MDAIQTSDGAGQTVAYLRAATADRTDSRLSLTRQQDACEDYARSLGIRITRSYFDVGASGPVFVEERGLRDRSHARRAKL